MYVDRPVFGADIDPRIDDVMQNLGDRFRMTDPGDVSNSLGMEVDVDHDKKTVAVRQSTYLKKIFTRHGRSDSRTAKIPISPDVADLFTDYEDRADKCTIKSVPISSGSSHMACYKFSPESGIFGGTWTGTRRASYLDKHVLRYVAGITRLKD